MDIQRAVADAYRSVGVRHETLANIMSSLAYGNVPSPDFPSRVMIRNPGRGPIFLRILTSFFTYLISPAAAISVNITVDDTFGNLDGSVTPTYLPAHDTWHAGSPTEQCSICTIKPSELDISQILDQSWHHATYFSGTPVQVQITFRGTAVYVYNVVPNFLPNGAVTFVNISFALDGETVGHFSHVPNNSSEIQYNQLVYANTSLLDSLHTLVMSASGSKASLIFFDYLLYTIETQGTTSTPPDSSPSSTITALSTSSAAPPIAAITGSVVGGVVLLLLVAALLLYRLRRHRRQTRPPMEHSNCMFTADAMPQRRPISVSESFVLHLSVGPLSDAATVAGEAPHIAQCHTVPKSLCHELTSYVQVHPWVLRRSRTRQTGPRKRSHPSVKRSST